MQRAHKRSARPTVTDKVPINARPFCSSNEKSPGPWATIHMDRKKQSWDYVPISWHEAQTVAEKPVRPFAARGWRPPVSQNAM